MIALIIKLIIRCDLFELSISLSCILNCFRIGFRSHKYYIITLFAR